MLQRRRQQPQPLFTSDATPEEILIALVNLGEDPDASRVLAVHARLAKQALPVEGREDAVFQAVGAARQRLDAQGIAPVRIKQFDHAEFVAQFAEREQVLSPERRMAARLRPYSPVSFGDEQIVCALVGDNVVGVACVCANHAAKRLELRYVSVDVEHRGRHTCSALLDWVARSCAPQGLSGIDASYYTKAAAATVEAGTVPMDGNSRVKPVLRRLARESGQPLWEDGIRYRVPSVSSSPSPSM